MTTRYEVSGDVATITLDRPDRFNAINAELAKAFTGHMARAATEARVVVITGQGKAFCAGADLTGFADEYAKGRPDLAKHLEEEFHPVVHAIGGCAIPVVAAVNGVAAGAGMGMALGCDIRVMAESAYFTSAFTAIGLTLDSGSTWFLPHHVGTSVAMEMAFTNRRMSAAEARDRGLCADVTPDDEVVDKAVEYASNLAAMSTDALVTTRNLIHGARRLTFLEALDREKSEQGRLGQTPAHHEGVTAFLEKRKADFKQF